MTRKWVVAEWDHRAVLRLLSQGVVLVKVLKDWESGALISLMMPVFMIENSDSDIPSCVRK